MKMGTGLFWGVILIVIGISIILRVFFDISVFRIVIAVLLILLGIKILIGRQIFNSSGDDNQVFFGERVYKIVPQNNAEYNTIFGKAVYDFREIDSLSDQRTKVSFNTVFGNAEILLPKALSVQVKADAVFSSARLPNGNTIAFGSANYNSEMVDSSAPKLVIEANVVFGSLDIRQ
jgi:hypothetical protein